MSKTYALTAIKDIFEQVPPDKVELCLSELAQGMVLANKTIDLISAAGNAMNLDIETLWPDICEWTDDDLGEITISVAVDE